MVLRESGSSPPIIFSQLQTVGTYAPPAPQNRLLSCLNSYAAIRDGISHYVLRAVDGKAEIDKVLSILLKINALFRA
jgi:hypothetical protein